LWANTSLRSLQSWFPLKTNPMSGTFHDKSPRQFQEGLPPKTWLSKNNTQYEWSPLLFFTGKAGDVKDPMTFLHKMFLWISALSSEWLSLLRGRTAFVENIGSAIIGVQSSQKSLHNFPHSYRRDINASSASFWIVQISKSVLAISKELELIFLSMVPKEPFTIPYSPYPKKVP
jgi:hypothetical protein